MTVDESNSHYPDHHRPQHIIIAGAGIIGTSTAYYLSKLHQEHLIQQRQHLLDDPTTKQQTQEEPRTTLQITIIDPSGTIAPAASGKAGGFLALHWNDFSPHALGPLARRGFELHSTLAQELGKENVMYRRLKCVSISVREQSLSSDGAPRLSGKKLEGMVQQKDDGGWWWDDEEHAAVVGMKELGNEETIAQVHPKMLCCAMWDEITTRGHQDTIKAQLIKGKVVNAKPANQPRTTRKNTDEEQKHTWDVELADGRVLHADAILYACGPWTTFGNCMMGVKYHSVIIPTRPKVLTTAVFYDGLGDPEVYPRPDGTAYCCGFPDDPVQVMEEPGMEEVRQEKVEEIVNAVRAASSSSSSSSSSSG
eukprot:CAMPEP_0176486016 /NCGR_PEP_ID=MMETSP0200_2-20121128/5345_1 /TAXON_ID=947934 /ORGANISM="Chaetoceros sp., Strain GSL56" /LENGTH=364 /DNA_ID=CAMNT_0017882693 /DNA_START=112 /DNA_END=1203 /DNA_ORIENTATION=-